MVSIHHIFGTTVSFKRDITSSILTFSNRSLKLHSLKNHFFMRSNSQHSMRTCLTVQGVWHVKHSYYCSCFGLKEWVSLVWPMRNWDVMTCSLLVFVFFLKASLLSPKVGRIWKSLSWMCCYSTVLMAYNHHSWFCVHASFTHVDKADSIQCSGKCTPKWKY